ncbi:MAG: deoxyguanosinetriphosphate triphosphohydrolase [Leptospiraceae bacterium]|nr:deoxyguanosinetriphosphate triphosphohydrolase [Leptospiraceae bacterium]MCZ8346455.1 deoxyguanosinetriphosphate triphosphohydrolase [Leptospiraceae bacterium]
MIKKFEDLIQEEDTKLAVYAVKHGDHGGRIFEEGNHEYRLPFQRDKDRIIHCQAFRRLEYKTQVFIASIGDNYRNRLTHTLEVSAITRTVALSLGLNTYLAETIALAHDLGHAPFGHAGQDVLQELMIGKGGFEHNKQSLRIVQYLENRYASFPGLNLCRETLMGIMKHGGDYQDSNQLESRQIIGPSLESMITDVCDGIAYNNHDVEDGYESNLLGLKDLKKIQIFDQNYHQVQKKYPQASEKLLVRETIRSMLNAMVTDLVHEIDSRLEENRIVSRQSLGEAYQKSIRLVGFSQSMHESVRELKKYLHEKLYKHPVVLELSNFGKEIIQVLFHYFSENEQELPSSYFQRMELDGKYRVICDYIAGMTDRYAEEIALDKDLIDPFHDI